MSFNNINDLIDYIKDNDSRLSIDDEIELIINFFKQHLSDIVDIEFNYDENLLSNTKLSLKDNNQIDLRANEGIEILLSIIINAILKDITEEEIMSYIIDNKEYASINKFIRITRQLSFENESIIPILLLKLGDDKKISLVNNYSEKFNNYEFNELIRELPIDEALKIIKNQKYKDKLSSFSYYDVLSQIDETERIKLLNQDYIINALIGTDLCRLIKSLDEKMSLIKRDEIIDKIEYYDLLEIIKTLSQEQIMELFKNKKITDKLGSDIIRIINDFNDDLFIDALLNPNIISLIDSNRLMTYLQDKSEKLIKKFLFNYDKIDGYIKYSKYSLFNLVKLINKLSNDYDILLCLKNENIVSHIESRDIFLIISNIKSNDVKYDALCLPSVQKYFDINYYFNIIQNLPNSFIIKCLKEESLLKLLSILDLIRYFELLTNEEILDLLNEDTVIDIIPSNQLIEIINLLNEEEKYNVISNKKIFIKILSSSNININNLIKNISNEKLMKLINDDEVFKSLNYYNIKDILICLSKDNLKIVLSYPNIKNKLYDEDFTFFEILTKDDNEKYKCILEVENNISTELLVKLIKTIDDNEIIRKILLNDKILSRIIYYSMEIIAKLDENDPKNSDFIKQMLEKPHFQKYALNCLPIIQKFIPENEMGVFLRIINSNSLELQKLGNRILLPLYAQKLSAKELNEKFDKVEEIFLRNNIPFFAKLFLCFQSLYPDLSKLEGSKEKFDFTDGGRMSLQLQDNEILKLIFRNDKNIKNAKNILDGPNTIMKRKIVKKMLDVRFGIIFNDLLRIAIGSNNRSLREYLDSIEQGNDLFLQIRDKKRTIESLTNEEKSILEVFISHLDVLYSYMKNSEELSLNEDSLIDKINRFSSLFKTTDRYSLPDRIVRSFCYYGGYKSFEELRNAINDSLEKANIKNEKNAKEIEGKKLKLEAGDFVRGIGYITSLSCLNDGNVCKEFLGPILGSSESDTTPLDSDWTRLLPQDIGETIEKTLIGTPTGFGFGSIFFVIKSNNSPSSSYIISKDESGNKGEKYNPFKIEMFQTGYDNHYGARTGTSTSDIDYIIFNEHCTNDKDPNFFVLSAIKNELVKTGIYIPVVNMSGELVFTKEEFNKLKNKLCGLKRYGCDEFVPSKYNMSFDDVEIELEDKKISIPSIEKIESMIRSDDDRREYMYRKIISHLSKYVLDNTKAKKLFTSLTGDLSDGIAELIGTGSTARGTNVPNDADFDFILRLDFSEMENHQELVFKLKSYLTPKELIPGKSQRFRGTGITSIEGLEGQEIAIDVTFSGKTNKMEYSTDSALEERLKSIKEQQPQLYDKVRANIVAAKMLLKQAHAYKPQKSDYTQGGLGGVGIENWILQNNGSLLQAVDDFLSYAVKDGKIIDFDEFVKVYHIWDYGANHEPKISGYPFDEFVEYNMNKEGYLKMCKVLLEFKKQLNKNKVVDSGYALS